MKPLYQELAASIGAYKRCAESGNTEWQQKHADTINLLESHLPHGSGYDSGTTVNVERSHEEKLVLETSFHHMDGNGYYSGWTEHTVTVTPSFIGGFHIRISGRNRNDIKEMMHQDFDYLLHQDVEYYLLHATRTDIEVVTYWKDESRCSYLVVNHLREHVYKPAIGDTVKLKTFSDYAEMGIGMWAWMQVITIYQDQYVLEVLNGSDRTGQTITVTLDAIGTPSVWRPTYDPDEILGTFDSFDAARQYAVRVMKLQEVK